jgi:hypothetical protein
MRKLHSLALWVALVGCIPGAYVPPVRPSENDPPVRPIPNQAADCEAAERNVAHCEGFGPSRGPDRVAGTADDISFGDVCRDIEIRDPELSLNPTCLAAAKTCDDAKACAGQ